MSHLTHITQDGERWDTLAWKYYRDVTQMGLLIEANQHAPIAATLPAGLVIQIPLIQQQPESTQGLPPWK